MSCAPPWTPCQRSFRPRHHEGSVPALNQGGALEYHASLITFEPNDVL